MPDTNPFPRLATDDSDGEVWTEPRLPSPWRPCRDMATFRTQLGRAMFRHRHQPGAGLGLLRAAAAMAPVGGAPMTTSDSDRADLVLDVRVGGEIDGSWASIRYARGEYLVLCEHLDGMVDARGLASRLAHRLAWPLEIGSCLVLPQVSVGIALHVESRSSPATLLARSIDTLRRAQQKEGLRIAIDPEE